MNNAKGANGKEMPGYFALIKAEFGTLKKKSGQKMQTYTWDASLQSEKRRGVIILVHGMSSYIPHEFLRRVTYPEGSDYGDKTGFEGAVLHDPKYEGSWVESLNKEGFTVVGMDNQSFGLSEGPLKRFASFFHRFENLVEDQVEFVESIKEKYSDQKLFMFGNSFGGGVAVRLAELMNLDGFILTSPMVTCDSLRKNPSHRFIIPILKLLSTVAPLWRVGPPMKKMPVKINQSTEDHLLDTKAVRSRTGAQIFTGCDTIQKNIRNITSPVFVMHSICDKITDPNGSEFLHGNASSQDKTIYLIDHPNVRHGLLQEPGYAARREKCLQWLVQRASIEKVDAVSHL